MTIIECPACKAKVDIDLKTVEKMENGTDLNVRCPDCGVWFVVARIALVRRKLATATHGYTTDAHGNKVRVTL